MKIAHRLLPPLIGKLATRSLALVCADERFGSCRLPLWMNIPHGLLAALVQFDGAFPWLLILLATVFVRG
jgi:hypothetical protein